MHTEFDIYVLISKQYVFITLHCDWVSLPLEIISYRVTREGFDYFASNYISMVSKRLTSTGRVHDIQVLKDIKVKGRFGFTI